MPEPSYAAAVHWDVRDWITAGMRKQLHLEDTNQTRRRREHLRVDTIAPLTSSAAMRNKDSEKLSSTFFFSKIFMMISCVRPGFSFSACVKFDFIWISTHPILSTE